MNNPGIIIRDIRVPYLAEYLGIWAMAEDRFMGSFELVRRMDIGQHIRDVAIANAAAPNQGSRRAYGYEITPDGIAIMDLVGTMMKQESSMGSSTSTVLLRGSIRNAKNDDAIKGVMMRADTPGGSVAGTQELADDIAALAKVKPVGFAIDDLCASAGVWASSGATFISANRSALVGCIGTYGVVTDMSRAAEQDGYKVHVIRAGKFKGAGVPGTVITDEQLADAQRIIDSLNQVFLSAISSGRKLSQAQLDAASDGRIHRADQAKAMGLIDQVESFDDAIGRLRSMTAGKSPAPSRTTNKGNAMAIDQELAATFPRLVHKYVGAGETRAQAIKLARAENPEAFAEYQKIINPAAAEPVARQQVQRAREEVQTVLGGATNLANPGARSYSPKQLSRMSGNPISEFNAAVKENMRLDGMSRQDAIKSVCLAQPELHKAYLRATNPNNPNL